MKTNEVLRFFNKVAKKLGVIVTEIGSLFVKQGIVESLSKLIFVVLIVIFGQKLVMHLLSYCSVGAKGIILGILIVIALLSVPVLYKEIQNILTGLINPKYYALMKAMEIVKSEVKTNKE